MIDFCRLKAVLPFFLLGLFLIVEVSVSGNLELSSRGNAKC